MAQAINNTTLQNMLGATSLFGGTVTNQGGAQGLQSSTSDNRRSLLG